MIELRVSEAAAISIVEQADYYQHASDLALAQRWESAVTRALRSLLSRPETGAPCHFRSQFLEGLRWMQVPGFPKHMVFYRYLPDEKAIVVVQVLHGARNLETLLDKDV